MSSEWTEYSLTDLYDISSGLSKPAKDFGSGYPFVSFKDVFANYFLPEKLGQLVQSSEREREKASVKKGDVFLTRTSETMHELGMSSVALKDYENATFNGFTKRLRVKPEMAELVVPEFIAYSLRSPSFRTSMLAFSTMSTRASLNNEMIGRLTVRLPKVDIQKKIGSILKCLDDKGANNSRLNAILEQIAQAIFKSWFVDFEPTKAKIAARKALLAENPAATTEQIATAERQAAIRAIAGAGDIIPTEQLQTIADLFPNQFIESSLGGVPEGWLIKPLDSIFSVNKGLSYKGKFLTDDPKEIPLLNLGNFGGNGKFRYEKVKYYSGEYKARHIVKEGQLVIANTDMTQDRVILGSAILVPELGYEAYLTTHHTFTTQFKESYPEEIWKYFVFYSLQKPSFRYRAEGFATGTTVLAMPKDAFTFCETAIPSVDLAARFSSLISAIKGRIRLNDKENETLEQLRDLLLPELLSGKIDLADGDKDSVYV